MDEVTFSDRFDALLESTARLLQDQEQDAAREQWNVFLSDVYRANAWDPLKLYSKACIEQLPNFHGGYLALGTALFNLFEYEKALEKLNKALKLCPGFLLTLRTKTETLKALERHEESVACALEALAVVEKQLEKEPENMTHFRAKIEMLQWAERWNDAVAFVEERLNAHPGDPDLINELAKALGVAGRGEEAFEVYEQAADLIKARPFSPDQLHQLFALLFNEGFMVMTTLNGQAGEDMVNTAEALMKLKERQAFEFRDN